MFVQIKSELSAVSSNTTEDQKVTKPMKTNKFKY
jgi:hypothetical protein